MSKVSGRSGAIVMGLVLIAFGLVFLLSSIDWLDAGDFFGTWWPSLIIILALVQIAAGAQRAGIGPWLILVVGIFLQAIQLDVLGWVNIGTMLAVLLILIGLWAIVKRPTGSKGETEPLEAEVLDQWVALGGTKVRVTSQQFGGGRAVAILGGHDIDLREAGLPPGESSLTLFAVLGGIDIFVPPHWDIIIEANPILGGVEDKRLSPPGGQPAPTATASRLRIRAIAALGGVDIKT